MMIRIMLALIVMSSGSALPHSTAPEPSNHRLHKLGAQPWKSQDFLQDRIETAQMVSNRCVTPYFWCLLPQFVPVGTTCWCATPNGPVVGVVR